VKIEISDSTMHGTNVCINDTIEYLDSQESYTIAYYTSFTFHVEKIMMPKHELSIRLMYSMLYTRVTMSVPRVYTNNVSISG